MSLEFVKKLKKQRYAHLLIAMLAIMNIAPFVSREMFPQVVISTFFFISILLAVRTLSLRGTLYWVALFFAILAFLSDVFIKVFPEVVPRFLTTISLYSAFSYAVLLALTIAVIIKDLLGNNPITVDKLCGSVCGYILLGIFWAFVYIMVYHANPLSFTYGKNGLPAEVFDLFYFSFVTLTTVGYGDIVPNTNWTKILISQEAISSTVYMSFLIARLVGLHSSKPKEEKRG